MSHITKLHQGVQQARERWVEAVKKVIPVGSIVQVYIGLGPVEIEVQGFASKNYREGQVWGVNTKTGARRQCHFTQIIGYDFSEYDRFGSLRSSLAAERRAAAQQGDAT